MKAKNTYLYKQSTYISQPCIRLCLFSGTNVPALLSESGETGANRLVRPHTAAGRLRSGGKGGEGSNSKVPSPAKRLQQDLTYGVITMPYDMVDRIRYHTDRTMFCRWLERYPKSKEKHSHIKFSSRSP